MSGDLFVPRDIQRQLAANRYQQQQIDSQLTKKQITVLGLLCEGFSNKQIAEHMFLTEHTVKSHLLTLYQKLEVKNRTECVLVSQQKGLLAKRLSS
jgi:DNA-binding NarL/FixJ family response regulator